MRPDWSFVLIGYPYDGNVDAVRGRISATPNVHYLGPKPYADLPAYLAHFDVATIPFVLNPITHGCSPVKLFEYMAGGRPAVCTPMREILKYRSVLVADTPDAFVVRIAEAKSRAGEPEYRALLRADAEANTWRARAEVLRDAVARAARDRTPGRAPAAEAVQ
jgi:glycosyltransferase involved in cell wall biosynthesis